MAKAKRFVDDAPEDTVFLSFYCEGSKDHPHPENRWKIVTFVLNSDPDFPLQDWPDGTPRWSELRNEYIPADRQTIRFDTRSTRTALVDNKPVSAEEFRANPAIFAGGSRSQYNLRCRICPALFPAKDDRLDRTLTLLHHHGVVETPLAVLRKTYRLLEAERLPR